MRIIREEKIDELICELIKKKPLLIVIDGEDGVGKSTKIGPCIASALKCSLISVDQYLYKKQDGYVDFINYDSLKKKIYLIENKSVIVEGVMALCVLGRMNTTYDYLIYVCKDGWLREWTEDETGNYKKSFSQIIADTERYVKVFNPKYEMRGFRREYYQYTYEYKPILKADVTLLVTTP